MRTSDFDYALPAELIAQRPLERGTSRLLTLAPDGGIGDRSIADLPSLLESGDLVVVNDTRVLRARLFGRRPGGGRAELLLVAPRDPEIGLDEAVEWVCLGRPRKKLRPGAGIVFDRALSADVVEHLAPDRLVVRFSSPPTPHLSRCGHVPLPPYITRADTEADDERYQTVFADVPGAVAAPTAGLHFDQALLRELDRAGVGLGRITLHVGPGTFRPVTAENIEEHPMESERYEIGEDTARKIHRTRESGGRVIAVGTTVVRTLESAALAGDGRIRAQRGETELFIRPGFEFRVVDRLLTNFHLPRSTLLMLVSAFAGRERVHEAYRHAVSNEYRFYSYGDAMLVDRPG